MTYDVPRWDCPDVLTMTQHPQGMWVLAETAEAHEKAAVKALTGAIESMRRYLLADDEGSYAAGYREAIRDCIAAVEAIPDGGDTDTRYILASTAATLRALLEGEK